MALFHIIYQSHSEQEWTSADLESLMIKSRAKNERLGVTGLLLYKDRAFLQAIEGDESVVRALYERIEKDPRHSMSFILFEERIERRGFADWSMGFRDLSREDQPRAEGFNDILNSNWAEVRLSEFPMRVKPFMRMFTSG